MDITKVTGREFLKKLSSLNANSVTLPEAKKLLITIRGSTENRERLVNDMLSIAEEDIKADSPCSDALHWAVRWCSDLSDERRRRLLALLDSISEKLMLK